MLTLTRRVGESIVINGNIIVHVNYIDRGKVSLCIDAPKDISIYRGEIAHRYTKTQPVPGDESHEN